MAQQEINYWLMKSEPDVYGVKQLKEEKITLWDGIRNYQARNFMRLMNVGDRAFFYHSNCKPPGIVGIMEVIKTGLIDPSQFDPNSKYYDQKSSRENPRWDCTQMGYIGIFKESISLQELRESFKPEDLQVVRRGNRLSIMPVPKETADCLLKRLGKPVF